MPSTGCLVSAAITIFLKCVRCKCGYVPLLYSRDLPMAWVGSNMLEVKQMKVRLDWQFLCWSLLRADCENSILRDRQANK
jgi:hypothetical protein